MSSSTNNKTYHGFSEYDGRWGFVQDRIDLLDTIKSIVEIEVRKQVNAGKKINETVLPQDAMKTSLLERMKAAFVRFGSQMEIFK